jgi:phosphoribosylformylglycinamidine synthase
VSFVSGLVGAAVSGGDPLVAGIHDVSGGGLGVALTEMAVFSGVGVRVAGVADHHELFTEAPSRVVVCTTRRAELISRAAGAGVGFRVLGETGGDRVVVEGLVDLSLAQATGSWRERLPSLLDGLAPATN